MQYISSFYLLILIRYLTIYPYIRTKSLKENQYYLCGKVPDIARMEVIMCESVACSWSCSVCWQLSGWFWWNGHLDDWLCEIPLHWCFILHKLHYIWNLFKIIKCIKCVIYTAVVNWKEKLFFYTDDSVYQKISSQVILDMLII